MSTRKTGLILSFWLAASSVAGSVAAQPEPSTLFSVLDLNMGGGEHLGGRSEAIVAYVKMATNNVFINVFTLQEVCSSQFIAIRDALGPEWRGTFRQTGGEIQCRVFGLAIFTRGPHSNPEFWPLPGPPTAEGRRWWGLMKVRYKGVDIFNTHIKNGRKVSHAQVVVERVQKSPLAVLAGDFNADPTETHIRALYRRVWHEVDFELEPTLGSRKIDYIWVIGHPTQLWGDASDSPSNHHALWGVITLPVP